MILINIYIIMLYYTSTIITNHMKYCYCLHSYTKKLSPLYHQITHTTANNRKNQYHSNHILHLNRILFERDECIESNESNASNEKNNLSIRLYSNDYRYQHITNILKLQSQDHIRCGIINYGILNSTIININDQYIDISLGNKNDIESTSLINIPNIDLILAIPRPLRLEKLLSVISCIGISKLILIGCKKVQKDYFGSHLLRSEKEMKKHLIEGLSQAEVDIRLPELVIEKDFRSFIKQIDELYPLESTHRILTHPIIPFTSLNSLRLFETLENVKYTKEKLVIVIGPEGGWDESEIEIFVNNQFHIVNAGNRILRTDMAVPVLLGIAHEWMDLYSKR